MERNHWKTLSLDPARVREARLQCHHAIQINTRLARGFVELQPDDSHTTLVWESVTEALIGRRFLHRGQLRAGLRIRDLTLLFAGHEFSLDNRTFNEALDWISTQLRQQGLDPTPLAQPIHFELDDHPLLHGAKFSAASCAPQLEELARYYADAATSIEDIATPVRCWPHHFDIAALIEKGKNTIGVGMSPGDASYPEPYFYVSPTPAPNADNLPPLHSKGRWHTQDWTGAVLTASQFTGDTSQEAIVRNFIEDALAVCAPLLT